MIALDTSSLAAYFSGDEAPDTAAVDMILEQGTAVIPSAVLSEILSEPKLKPELGKLIRDLPRLEVTEGYWERVGVLRAKIISKGFKARLADALIAQNCLDHNVPLVTRDGDFRHFARIGGLKLFPELKRWILRTLELAENKRLDWPKRRHGVAPV